MRSSMSLAVLLLLASAASAGAQVPVVGNQTVPALPPSGAIFFITSGTCPTGTTEASDLQGKTLFGTLAANKDVGGTGGSDAITPAGTNTAPAFTGNAVDSSEVSGGTPAGTIAYPVNVPTFSGNAVDSSEVSGGTPAGTLTWPVGVPTFTGTSSTAIVNHLHTLATGTGSSGNFAQVIGTVDTTSGGTGGTPTQTALGTRSGNPVSGGVSSYTPEGTIAWPAGVPAFSGSALANHKHSTTATGSVAWPANPPTFSGSGLANHKHSTTATGSVAAPVFTGTQFDNRSAYIKVIFCRVD